MAVHDRIQATLMYGERRDRGVGRYLGADLLEVDRIRGRFPERLFFLCRRHPSDEKKRGKVVFFAEYAADCRHEFGPCSDLGSSEREPPILLFARANRNT